MLSNCYLRRPDPLQRATIEHWERVHPLLPAGGEVPSWDRWVRSALQNNTRVACNHNIQYLHECYTAMAACCAVGRADEWTRTATVLQAPQRSDGSRAHASPGNNKVAKHMIDTWDGAMIEG